MSRAKDVAIGLAVALLSLWLGATVITFLPDGTIALHTAALLSTVIVFVGGLMFAYRAWDSA